MEQEPKIENNTAERDTKNKIASSLIRIHTAASKIKSMLESPSLGMNETTLKEFAEDIIHQANTGADALSELEE